MGAVDDTRKVLQDLITPDLKALEARVVALEHKMDLKFDHVDKKIEMKFDQLDKKIDMRSDHLDKKIDMKFDLLWATLAANHAAIMHSLDLDRRLERLESDKSNQKGLERPS